ncbi:MAG: type I methionyl aminopeptidase [Lawsonella sp.]
MRRRTTSTVPTRTPAELEAMEAAGRIVGRTLRALQKAAVPGVSTFELDEIAETLIREAGATPSFKGYAGFPASICASLNDVVVHGIPRKNTILQEGDLLSIDCGAILDGWHGDSAISIEIGEVAPDVAALNKATEEVLFAGIAQMVPGNRLTDISHAIQQATRKVGKRAGYRFRVVKNFGGHGIGREMHQDPFLPNEGRAGKGPRIAEGSVLAIEPMLSLGSPWTEEWDDGWTTVIEDGAYSAHWEHTVAATSEGPRILTPRSE